MLHDHDRPRMVVHQLALPHYRQALLDILAEANDQGVLFEIGDSQFYEGVTAEVSGENVVDTGRNIFIFKRRLAIQRVNLRRAFSSKTTVIELNPRILNAWLVLVVRRVMRQRTLSWGHVFPRAGRSSRTEMLRRRMRSLTSGMIVYTESEAIDFKSLHPGKEVYVASNAIYRESEMVPKPATLGTDFIVIGRLVDGKKPLLALDAFRLAASSMPDARLVFIGKGPLEKSLEEAIDRNRLRDRVELLGHVTEWSVLRDRFHRAVAMLGPGYIGLNATQSLGFGIPVVFAKDEPHAPEIEALNQTNSATFSKDDAEGLARTMVDFWKARADWARRSQMMSDAVRARYSAEAMAAAFVAAAS